MQIMYCLFDNFVGSTSWLGVTEITKLAISFHCDTPNTSSTHSCRATAGINVKMIVQKVRIDAEQNLMGCFAEFKINSRILPCF